ncbi:MAG: hypothetical protein ACFFDN_29330 [Candidatus Hodarchaeota archaeon]
MVIISNFLKIIKLAFNILMNILQLLSKVTKEIIQKAREHPVKTKVIILLLTLGFCPIVLLRINFITLLYLFSVFLIVTWISKRVINTIIIIAVFLILWIAVEELTKNSLIIHINSIPEEFQEQSKGYTSEIFEKHMIDKINEIHNIANDAQGSIFSSSEDLDIARPAEYSILTQSTLHDIDIKIQEVGLSLNSLSQYIKKEGYFQKIFGYKFCQITGDLTHLNNDTNWIFTIRISNRSNKITSKIEWQGDSTLLKATESIIKEYDLSTLMN